MVSALLLDLSGVLYDGDELIPGALEAIARAQASGLSLRFLTNTSRKTRVRLLAHLRDLGFTLESEQLFTAVDAARGWLQTRHLRPYCLVHRDILGEFADFDQREPNAVLVADAADDFNYANLNHAFQLCLAGAPLVGIGYNRCFKAGGEMLLDAGAFIRALEFAAGVKASIVGKPAAHFFRQALASTGVGPASAMMVGDDVFGDVAGALGAGIPGCLVRTGKYLPGDESRIDGDFATVASIVEAVELALS